MNIAVWWGHKNISIPLTLDGKLQIVLQVKQGIQCYIGQHKEWSDTGSIPLLKQ